ncbi:hypothetical protein BDK92_7294 [Micromonospora pisi]|uniref:Uncharacterized protein n=1 Tax=Micromonospora pisi TaxID=589240 RepID=A0A495JWT0_9ACTN|nr:hypothetical protein [Micromonospora pisi]RKR92812.1 hypothetical protein BDK92_7294 [Micromonospora pisi]
MSNDPSAVARTRPGYATYANTPSGDPTWPSEATREAARRVGIRIAERTAPVPNLNLGEPDLDWPPPRTYAEVRAEDTAQVCPRCGSPQWVSVSLDGGWTCKAQCVPCGAYHPGAIGLGWRSLQGTGPEFGTVDASQEAPADSGSAAHVASTRVALEPRPVTTGPEAILSRRWWHRLAWRTR